MTVLHVWYIAAGLCGASVLGSLLGFAFKALPQRLNDTVLGYCAGIMLAASTLGLIVPAYDGTDPAWWWLVSLGVVAGAAALNVLDLLTPHLHHLTGMEPEAHTHNKRLGRVLLFVMAIALHKLPEGLAAGVSLLDSGGSGLSVSLGLAVQNVPEGMVAITPLLLAGVSRWRALAIALTIGALEIAGVWIGYGVGVLSAAVLPVMLAFAGGAMLYVVSDEMIPETHTHGYQKQATYALLLGFITILLVERVL